MAEDDPSLERIHELAYSVTFCLRTDEDEVMELPQVLHEPFRRVLAKIWVAAFYGTRGNESL
jgi:hypothetical protein